MLFRSRLRFLFSTLVEVVSKIVVCSIFSFFHKRKDLSLVKTALMKADTRESSVTFSPDISFFVKKSVIGNQVGLITRNLNGQSCLFIDGNQEFGFRSFLVKSFIFSSSNISVESGTIKQNLTKQKVNYNKKNGAKKRSSGRLENGSEKIT